MAKGSIDKETDIVGVGGVDDVVAVNLQDSTCLQPGNGGFEDRLKASNDQQRQPTWRLQSEGEDGRNLSWSNPALPPNGPLKASPPSRLIY